jgi:hypothetical protein
LKGCVVGSKHATPQKRRRKVAKTTANLGLNKWAGNLENLYPDARMAAQDADLDKIDAFLSGLAGLVGFEVHHASEAIAIKEGIVLLSGNAFAMTLAKPIAGARPDGGDDGKKLKIVAIDDGARTVTTPVFGINIGDNTIAFAAPGDWAELVAYSGSWYATLGGPTPARSLNIN